MERGSFKHSPRVDEQMSHEVQGAVQGSVGARAEEWKMAEPAGEDQPEISVITGARDAGRDVPDGVGNPRAEAFSRFGTYIGLSALPGDREALERSARDLNAPDDVLDDLARLPDGVVYATVAQVWNVLNSEE
jgi:hypothetical protein